MTRITVEVDATKSQRIIEHVYQDGGNVTMHLFRINSLGKWATVPGCCGSDEHEIKARA